MMMDIPPRVSVRRQPIDLAALSFICAANDNVSRVASDFKLFVNNSLQEAFQTQIIKGFCDLWSIEDVPQARDKFGFWNTGAAYHSAENSLECCAPNIIYRIPVDVVPTAWQNEGFVRRPSIL